MRWVGEGRDAHRVLEGKPEGKRPLGRTILRWFFRKWDGWGMDWIYLFQDRNRCVLVKQ
jgi:hypothetical protein